MSEIRKLIEKLCPDGVEYWKLGDISEVLRGRRLTKKELSEEGVFPVYHGGIEPIGYYSQGNRSANTVMIINVGASAGTVGFCSKPFWSSDGCFCLSKSQLLNDRYLFYILSKDQKSFVSKVRHAGIPTLDAKVIANFEIPVPPMEVQSKIVEILDNFTELEAELEARRKQYEYYRNQLFSFEDSERQNNVKWMALGEIGTFTRGNGLQKKDFIETGFPCIHYGQIYTRFGLSTNKPLSYCSDEVAEKLVKAKTGDMIIACTSENIEDVCKAVVWLGDGEVATGGHSCVFSHKQNPKYVAYYFQTEHFFVQKKKYAKGVKVIDVKASDMAKITIPIPPLEEQERIVSILDRFEALTTNLQSGLPAEIDARRKQYEYYREQLLTFKRKTA